MSDVTLSAAVRDNLLSLQNTASLMSQTQGRLSTGLKVASAIDDPVAFFQGKALTDRSSDFEVKRGFIDQGVSSLNAATNGIEAIESVVKQMQGLVLSARSATTEVEITNVVAQFNDLRVQIDSFADDATYQGTNLISSSSQVLEVSFSNLSTSFLNVQSQDTTSRGLGINEVGTLLENRAEGITSANVAGFDSATDTGIAFDYAGDAVERAGALAYGEELSFTVAMTGTEIILSSGSAITFSYGTRTVTAGIAAGGTATATFASGQTLTSGQVLTLTISSLAAGTAAGHVAISDASTNGIIIAGFDGQTSLGLGMSRSINNLNNDLDDALISVRSSASILGANSALLSTRLDFTNNYENTLTGGAGKLTLADLNEESANALALQTRQQLGIQALSMANQAEQGVLGLF